jgi:hypothetical protein
VTFDEARQSAIDKFCSLAIGLTKRATALDDKATRLMDKVVVIVALCELPGDAPLRAYCQPNVLALEC